MRIEGGRLVAEAGERGDPGLLADCRARLAFDLLAGTWTGVVLYALRDGPRRPGELRGRIGGISQKVLTETLRRLEHDGLVARRRYAEAPPRVEYALTGPGRGLLEPLSALGRWTELYADEILDAQDRAEQDEQGEREERDGQGEQDERGEQGARGARPGERPASIGGAGGTGAAGGAGAVSGR